MYTLFMSIVHYLRYFLKSKFYMLKLHVNVFFLIVLGFIRVFYSYLFGFHITLCLLLFCILLQYREVFVSLKSQLQAKTVRKLRNSTVNSILLNT